MTSNSECQDRPGSTTIPQTYRQSWRLLPCDRGTHTCFGGWYRLAGTVCYPLPLSREDGAGALCGSFHWSRELSSLMLCQLHALVADLLGRGSLVRSDLSCFTLKNRNSQVFICLWRSMRITQPRHPPESLLMQIRTQIWSICCDSSLTKQVAGS